MKNNNNWIWIIIGIVALFLIIGKGDNSLFSSVGITEELREISGTSCNSIDDCNNKYTIVFSNCGCKWSLFETNKLSERVDCLQECPQPIENKPTSMECINNMCNLNIGKVCPQFAPALSCEERDYCKITSCDKITISESKIVDGCTYPATFDCIPKPVPKPISWLQQSVYDGIKVWHLLLVLSAIIGYLIFKKK